jgi:hypothetical protein
MSENGGSFRGTAARIAELSSAASAAEAPDQSHLGAVAQLCPASGCWHTTRPCISVCDEACDLPLRPASGPEPSSPGSPGSQLSSRSTSAEAACSRSGRGRRSRRPTSRDAARRSSKARRAEPAFAKSLTAARSRVVGPHRRRQTRFTTCAVISFTGRPDAEQRGRNTDPIPASRTPRATAKVLRLVRLCRLTDSGKWCYKE